MRDRDVSETPDPCHTPAWVRGSRRRRHRPRMEFALKLYTATARSGFIALLVAMMLSGTTGVASATSIADPSSPDESVAVDEGSPADFPSDSPIASDDVVLSLNPTSVSADNLDPTDSHKMTAMKTWAACGVFTDRLKVVRQFSRQQTQPPNAPYFGTGRGTLACGSDKWGYRHIVQEHESQWEYRAFQVSGNWRDVADFGIEWALKNPYYVTYRKSNDTYCYGRTIYLLNKKTLQRVGQYEATVIIGHNTQNIITAYPPNKRECKNS